VTQFHLLSFEGPDLYACAGGLATRVGGLAEALADRFETPGRVEAMRRAALRTACNYSWKRVIGKYLLPSVGQLGGGEVAPRVA